MREAVRSPRRTCVRSIYQGAATVESGQLCHGLSVATAMWIVVAFVQAAIVVPYFVQVASEHQIRLSALSGVWAGFSRWFAGGRSLLSPALSLLLWFILTSVIGFMWCWSCRRHLRLKRALPLSSQVMFYVILGLVLLMGVLGGPVVGLAMNTIRFAPVANKGSAGFLNNLFVASVALPTVIMLLALLLFGYRHLI